MTPTEEFVDIERDIVGPQYKLTHTIWSTSDQEHGCEGQNSDFLDTYLPLVAKICMTVY